MKHARRINLNLTLEICQVKIGIDIFNWRLRMSRLVSAWALNVGPFFIVVSGLSFSKKAARKEFDRMNHPDSPLRRLTDLYRNRG